VLTLPSRSPQKWGLDVSEMLLMANTFTAVAVILLHSHRTIILRRIWLMLGLLYYYRALTMMITVLPKSDKDYECHPKQNETTPMSEWEDGNQTIKVTIRLCVPLCDANPPVYVERVLTIISGGGLSINGKHVFCGDYIFSGHTMTLTLGYLAIKHCEHP
jgi:shingomyelin synthase